MAHWSSFYWLPLCCHPPRPVEAVSKRQPAMCVGVDGDMVDCNIDACVVVDAVGVDYGRANGGDDVDVVGHWDGGGDGDGVWVS